MPLIVEDGTGKAGANAYQSAAEVAAYAADHALPWAPTSDAAGEAALRNAATWMDATFRTRLPGARLKGRAQGLEWPRRDATDASGEELPSDEVPAEWLSACAEVATRLLLRPGSLSPDVVVGKVKRSVSVSGAVSVTYADDGDIVGSQRPVLTMVEDLLSGLLGDNLQTGRSVVKFLRRA